MPTKDETRQAIIEAAEILFSRFGPTKTSVADIARKLGMSSANIYNFFPSRDAILEAVGQIHLTSSRESLLAETSEIEGDWPKIENLFLKNARRLRDLLANETDILHLQALEAQHQWKFVIDYHAFLMKTVHTILTDAMQAGRFRKQDPSEATTALFDCMLSALDPVHLRTFGHLHHERRIKAQLALLERAFR
jgi:AcrR family transcriptional regulator